MAVAGGPPPPGGGRGGRGAGGRGGRGAPDDGPGPPSRLLALAIDGATPLPGVPDPEEDED